MTSKNEQLEMHHLNYSIDRFMEVVEKQSRKGIETYKQDIDPMESGRDWLDMGDEELVDAFRYNQAERQKRAFIAGKLRKLTSYKPTDVTRKEIDFWLDVLEGKA